MRPIPIRLRNLLEAMPRMRVCEMAGEKFGPCEGKIDWHHCFIYAGQQLNEMFAILAACRKHHDMVKTDVRVKEAFELRSLEYATEKDLDKYPKKAWRTLKKYLEVKTKK